MYAFVLKANEKSVKIRSLSNLLNLVNEIKSVELLGSNAKLTWEQNRDGLVVQLPEKLPTEYATVLKIGLDDLSSQQWELIIE